MVNPTIFVIEGRYKAFRDAGNVPSYIPLCPEIHDYVDAEIKNTEHHRKKITDVIFRVRTLFAKPIVNKQDPTAKTSCGYECFYHMA